MYALTALILGMQEQLVVFLPLFYGSNTMQRGPSTGHNVYKTIYKYSMYGC